MPKEYDENTLRRLQLCELGILKDFLKVCQDNGLSCFGHSGTAIGAIRHGGFIPWDDDIDVGLLRADYDKALEIIKRDYSDKYTVVNFVEQRNYPLATTRILLNDSAFIEESLQNIKCPLGIFLDVYAFDNVAKDEKAAKKQARKVWLLSKLLILRFVSFPVLPFKGIKGKLAHAVTAVAHFFLWLFRVSPRFISRKLTAESSRYNGQDCDAYAYFCGGKSNSNYYNKKDLFPLKVIRFEDIDLPFPGGIENVLTAVYGDYMQLPPPEKRKNHFPYKLKFPGESEELMYEE